MSHRTHSVLFLLMILALGSGAAAQTTWTGGAGTTDWNTASNWSNGVPTPTTGVTIPAGTPTSPSTALATAECAALTVDPGAALTIAAGSPVSVSGALSIQGALSASDRIRLLGTGTVATAAGVTLPTLEVMTTTTRTLTVPLDVGGDLIVQSGNARPSGTGNLTVSGDVSVLGGTLSTAGSPVMLIAGDVSITGGNVAFHPEMRVDGDWTSNASLQVIGAARIRFTGNGGPQAVSVGGSRLGRVDVEAGAAVTQSGAAIYASPLVVDGDLTVNDPLEMDGTVTINGTMTATAALDFDSATTVSSTGTLDLGAGSHTFNSSTTVNGTLITTGTITLDGNGAFDAGTNPLADVCVAASGQCQLRGPVTISGDLTLSAGTWGPSGTGSLAVAGDLMLMGGTLTIFASVPIDVAGNVTVSNMTNVFAPPIECAGDWTSDATYDTTTGTVTFDGPAAQIVSATGSSFSRITVAAGSSVTATTPITMRSLLTVDGSLTVPNGLDVGANTTIGASGTLDLGSGSHSFTNTFTNNGTLVATGTITLDGSGTLNSGTSSLPDVVLNGTGQRILRGPMSIAGDLTVNGGQFGPNGTGQVDVSGDLLVQNATITVFGAVPLDVAGDVTMSNLTGAFPPPVFCAGTWTSDASFSTSFGTVTFDGAGGQTINSNGSIFNHVVIAAGTVITNAAAFDTNGSLTVDGDLSSTAAVSVGGAFNVNGTVTTTASFDVDGSTTIGAAGSLDLGIAAHSFGGSFTENGSLTVGGTLTFDGAGTVNVTTPLIDVVVDGTSNVILTAPMTVTGDLSAIGGTVGANGTGAILIQGNASFTACNLTVFSGAAFDVDGDATITNMTGTFPPTIRCAGAWTSDATFDVSSSVVVFDGAGAQAFSAAGSTFNAITIEAGTMITAASSLAARGAVSVDGGLLLSMGGDLQGTVTVSGSLTTTGPLDVGGAVNVMTTGSLDLGNLTHTFASNFIIDGSLTASGTVTFDGGGSVSSATDPLPAVRIDTAGTVALNAPIVMSSLDLLAGSTGIGNVATAQVLNDFNATGGTLLSFNGTLDVDGNVTFAGVVTAQPSSISCAGTWTSDAGFDAVSGTVTFDGSGLQSVSAPGSVFFAVTVSPGTTVNLADSLLFRGVTTVDGTLNVQSPCEFDGTVNVNGTLTASQSLDLDGAVNVAPAGTLDLGSTTHTFAGVVMIDGTVMIGNTLTFDGIFNATITAPTAAFLDVVVNKTGSLIFLGGASVGGDLELVSGDLSAVGPPVNVAGEARFLGGSLVNNGGAFDVTGDVTIQNLAAGGGTNIVCRGDYRADSQFTPSGGRITLAGAPGSTMGSLDGGPLTFAFLSIESGIKRPESALTLDVLQADVEPGGRLETGGFRLAMNSGTLSVDGELALGAGDELALGAAATVRVESAGMLSLLGSPLLPARVSGEAGGGYAFRIFGTIEAMNYVFEEMGPGGVRLEGGSMIAPAPNDLRGGRFDNPSMTAGATMLEIIRGVPTSLRYVEFENSNGANATNVRTIAAQPVTLVNWSGAIAGPAFEDDPNNLITWGPQEGTGLTSFAFRPLGGRVRVRWETSAEFDLTEFRVERSTASTGPFTAIANVAPAGAGTAYVVEDVNVAQGQLYFYRLVEELTHGPVRELAFGSATPLSTQPPANFYVVGSAEPFGDVQSALAAATEPQSVVMIRPGTYPSFAIGGVVPPEVRVIGDGAGPVIIDTSLAPVLIQNTTPGQSVELSGLDIGSPSSGNAGVVVSNCLGTVVLTGCTVQGTASLPGVNVLTSGQVAVQGSDLAGTPGLRFETGSTGVVTRGSVDALEVLTGSTASMADVVPGSTLVDPGATLDTLPGIRPEVTAPAFLSLGSSFTIGVEGQALQHWFLLLGTSVQWFDLGNPSIVELVGLVSLDPAFGGIAVVDQGVTDAGGLDARTFSMFQTPSTLGFKAVWQLLNYDAATGRYRWSNGAATNIMP